MYLWFCNNNWFILLDLLCELIGGRGNKQNVELNEDLILCYNLNNYYRSVIIIYIVVILFHHLDTLLYFYRVGEDVDANGEGEVIRRIDTYVEHSINIFIESG